ncbi:MAG TPA: AI-2E family transporter, partial [Caldimonas sp.]|nr:AI-2E family transporter [Caldimonas sp.]
GQVWQGVGLVVFSVVVIGLIDNILRPILVGKNTQLPDYLILLSTIGGLAVIGLNGFVIGPVIAAMFVSAWQLFASERRRRPSVDAST